MIHPTKATPFGCVIGFFGILALGLSGLCWRVFFLAKDVENLEKAAEMRETFAMWGTLAALVGIAIVVIGYRLAINADMRDPYDPSRPNLR